MKNKIIALALSAVLLALCIPAQAQQPGKIPRIGYLAVSTVSAHSPRVAALRQGLREWLGDSAECAGTGGSGHKITRSVELGAA